MRAKAKAELRELRLSICVRECGALTASGLAAGILKPLALMSRTVVGQFEFSQSTLQIDPLPAERLGGSAELLLL
jgi:hypothetical protein